MRDLLKISVKASRVRPIIALLGLTVAAAALSYVSAERFNSRGTPFFRVSSPLRAGQSPSTRVRSATSQEGSRPDSTAGPKLAESYGKLPLSFEPNLGQAGNREIQFISRGNGYLLGLSSRGAVLALRKGSQEGSPQSPVVGSQTGEKNSGRLGGPESRLSSVLRMNLVGADVRSEGSGVEELPGRSNYFIGNDPQKWHSNVPTYSRVRFQGVLPGVDLVYYGNQRQLEYDFVVAPGSDPQAIKLQFEGAKQVRVDQETGDLVLNAPGGEVRFHKPIVYQEISQPAVENRKFLDGRYKLIAKNQVQFDIPEYDRSQPLIIDPVLSYSTYLGGNSTDIGTAIAVDLAGSAYVVGYTISTNFPTTAGALDVTCGTDGTCNSNYDVFVSKLNPAGTALVYSTYLGGSGQDISQQHGIAVDSSGSAYVTGYTYSTNFPIVNGFQTVASSLPDVYVTRLSADGSSLLYSTYLGGNSTDIGYGIAADSLGNAYVTGYTYSSTFPTKNRFQGYGGGGTSDAFVSKIDTTRSGANSLIYSTYLGGNNYDVGLGVAVDSLGSAYVTGYTLSPNFPTLNPVQGTIGGGYDAFITKLSPAGSSLVYSTYLGGTSDDEGQGIALDSSGNASITGFTYSSNYPTLNAIQGALVSGPDSFVTELNAAGSALIYSTYLGGNSTELAYGIALDSTGNTYVSGYTCSTNFPTANPFQATNASNGCYDTFVTKIKPGGTGLIYSTFLGGNSQEIGYAVAADDSGAYVTGYTYSTNFPTKNPIQGAIAAAPDAFVMKLVSSSYANLSPKSVNFGTVTVGTSVTQTVTLTDTGELPLNISSIAITGTNAADYALAGSGTCPYTGGTIAIGSSCTIDVTFAPIAAFTRTAAVTLTDDASGNPQTISLSGFGTGPAVTLTPTSLNYGDEVVGLGTSYTGISVRNVGNATLAFSSISADLADFQISNGCGSSLTAGSTCTVFVRFVPTVLGTRNGTLTLTDNAIPGTQTVGLTGVGVPTPVVSLSPSSLSFGLVPINTTSAPQQVTLSNTAGSTLLVSSIAASVPFSQTNNCGGSVTVGSSCTINVTFSPAAASQGYGGTLYVYDNTATGSPQQVSLSGTGQGPLALWTPAILTFPRQALNTTSASQTATFRNTGNGAMAISNIAAFGDYSQTNNCPSSLAAGASCTFTVTFTPTGLGPRTGAVSISDDAVNGPHSLSLLGNHNYLFNRLDQPTGGYSGDRATVRDLNNDGRPDIVVPDSNTNAVSILLGAPDGKFQNKADFPTGINPLAVAVDDFNGDGKMDLVTANYSGNNVSVLLGNGDATFQAPVNYTGNGNPRDIVTSDFNGDGKVDIAYANYSGTVSLRLGNGSGSFGNATNWGTNISLLNSLATADFNGDGKLDLVVGSLGGYSAVSVLLGNGNGTFQSPSTPSVQLYPYSVVTGDFNGDGKQDVASLSLYYGVSILLGNGNGTFQPATTVSGGYSQAYWMTKADLNGDGKDDLALQCYSSGNAVNVLLGNGNGTFQAPTSYPISNGAASVTVGDFNGDGSPDLVIPSNSFTTVSVLLNNGNGTFGASRTDTATNTNPRSIATGDFNGDSKLDAAVANYGSGSVSILLGNGSGGFQTGTTYTTGSGAYTVTAADFNGDSKLDLAVANLNSNTVSILLGVGDGTFQAPTTITVSYAVGVTTGDFNGDGKADLAVTSYYNNVVYILKGNGNGTFTSPAAYSVGTGYYLTSVAAYDFNGDGKLDLAVSNANYNKVAILLGNGDGTFQPGVNYSTGANPLQVTVGDFNGDGKLDLALANTNDGVSVLLGNGDGTFKAHVDYTVGSNPYSITSSDFNGDGKLDLLVANYSSNTVSVLLGNGDGSFQPRVDLPVGTNPIWAATGDFDGDGSADLAVANYATASMSTYLNKGVIAFYPAPLDFGSLFTNTTSSPQTILVSNPGSQPLTVASLAASGDFAETDNCVGAIPVSGNCTINVTFTPTAAGTRTGSVSVSDSFPGGPHSVPLSGTGILTATANLSGTSLAFGSQPVGSSTSQSVTLSNNGNVALTISSFAIDLSSDYSESDNCNGSVAPSGSCQVTVIFTPAATGSRNGTLTITDNASPATQTISLTGTGTQASTSTAINAPDITFGANGGVTVTVTSSGGTVTGNVSLSVDGGTPTSQALSGGSTVFALSGLGAGDHSLNATYSAQGAFGASSAAGNLHVNKADQAAVVVTAPSDVNYGSTGTAAAAGGSGTGAYSFNAGSPTGCSVAGTVVSVSNASGTCVLTATRAGDANYNPSAASAPFTVTLRKADATISVTPYNATYDGNAHTATGIATGVGNVDLSSQLTLSGTTHTNAGTYNGDAWSFAGGTNYNDASGTVNDSIAKATATINVTPYNVTYDGNAHTATGTATGVGGVDLSGQLTLSNTTHTNAGTYNGDTWSFAGGANYGDANGTVDDAIGKATATVTLGNLSQTFNGMPRYATATTNPTGLTVNFTYDSFATAPTGAGSYAVVATVSDNNYQGSAAGTLVIGKATPTITWSNPADITYGTALTLATQLNATANAAGSFAYSPGPGTYLNAGSGQSLSVTFTPSDTTNYNTATKSVTINVNPAPLTVTANNATKILNAPNPAFSGTYSGFVRGETSSALTPGALTCTTTATTTSPAGSYPITCSGQSSSNYSITYNNGTLTITYAPVGGVCYGDIGHAILQPINVDGSSVFKQGSTVPNKFRVCDANGVSIGTPGVVTSFNLTGIIAGTLQTVNETVTSTTPDATFRWDSTAQQWIFNTSTKGLNKNQTYIFTIGLNDGSTIMFQYGLR